MDSKSGKANLKQYRRIGGRWQFVPVVKQDGKPNPKLVLINGEPASSKGGTFYVEWRENGKRKRAPAEQRHVRHWMLGIFRVAFSPGPLNNPLVRR